MGRLSDADAEQIADEVGDGQSGRATEHHLITASRGELPPIRALLAPVRTSVGSTAMKVLGVEDVALSAASRRPAAELAVVSRLFVRPGARGRQLGEGLIRTASQYGSSRGFGLVLEVVRAPRSAAIALYERLGCLLVGQPPRRMDDTVRRPTAALPVSAGYNLALCLTVLNGLTGSRSASDTASSWPLTGTAQGRTGRNNGRLVTRWSARSEP